MLRAGATHYEPISWDSAVASPRELNCLSVAERGQLLHFRQATTRPRSPTNCSFGSSVRHLPDRSNTCHEASGNGLTRALGFGKGTVKLEDFAQAQLIFIVGHNPGTNHPRMLTMLEAAKRAGARIVAVNPLPETGLIAFMNPQEPLGLLGKSVPIADIFLQIRINGDVPLFKGILKSLIEADDRQRGSGIDWDFVEANTAGVEALLQDVRAANWDTIERVSGIARSQIEAVAEWGAECRANHH